MVVVGCGVIAVVCACCCWMCYRLCLLRLLFGCVVDVGGGGGSLMWLCVCVAVGIIVCVRCCC